MIVKELIELLQKKNPDEVVLIAEPERGDTYTISSVSGCGSMDGHKVLIEGGEWDGNVY